MGDELLAYCGLACQTCPIYLATRQEDQDTQRRMRTEILRLCNQQYGISLSLQDITDCDGCRSEGRRLFSGCKDCPIRNCARQRGVENCAYCENYACAQLEVFLRAEPSARVRLDAIRNQWVA